MKINLGLYKKNKETPRVLGPRRRVSRKVLAAKAIHERNNKNNSDRKKFLIIILFVFFFIIIAGAIWRFNYIKNPMSTSDSGNLQICDNILNPACWSDVFKPSFKQADGYTNALLVGIDTRPAGNGTDLKNTDTIIIASVNHTLKKTMLISIPRDMLVTVKIKGSVCCTMKINSIYALADFRNDVDDGMKLLAENIEQLLGIKIQYTALVNFEAVKAAVDAIGGITINIPDNITVQYPEETPPYNYKYYEFKKGPQQFDGHMALVWARFRIVWKGPEEYGSDFSRAVRQQEVIDAIKEKVLKDEGSITEKAQKYWKLYQTFSDNVITDGISFEDVLAAASLVSEYDSNPINVVLDPYFGGTINKLVYHPPTDEQFGYYITPRDNTWQQIKNEIAKIWKYPGVYDDKAIVTISNRSANGLSTDSPIIALQHEGIPFGSLFIITESKLDTTGMKIYDFSNGVKQRTIDFLKEYFKDYKFEVVTNPFELGITRSIYKEDIKVEFGPPEKIITE